QLVAMAQLWGYLEVEYAYGRGGFSSESTTEPLTYGHLVSARQGTAYLEYQWSSGQRPTVAEIHNNFRDRAIPDISLDRLAYRQRAVVEGEEVYLLLQFGKQTVHPQDYGKLVVDGVIPKQEMYETIKRTKKELFERGAPPETVKRMRYSGLVLHEISPHRDLIYDAHATFSLKKPNMMFMEEIYKRWTLWDYELRTRA
nr:hypothetical protein [Candidatus Njordarchaeota archaeon]